MQHLSERMQQFWEWMKLRAPTRRRSIIVAGCVAFIAAGLTIILSCYPAGERREPPFPGAPTIRARLAEGSSQLRVSAASTASWRKQDSGEQFLTGSGPWQVQPRPGGIQVGDSSVFGSAVVFAGGDSGFRLDDKQYRGKLVIHRTDSGLTAVNALTVEEYLRGVVPSEMPASWPAEALAAQAVAARTFVLHKIRGTQGDTWNLKAIELAYRGTEREDPRATSAIRRTSGVVLNHGGDLFKAYFHSTCGGHTAPAEKVFDDSSIQPLTGVPCDWCRDSSYYSWTARMTARQLASKLSSLGIRQVNSIETRGRGEDGHAQSIVVNGRTVNANRFRLAVGAQKLRSTNFTVRTQDGTFVFSGNGWGHGVGMCQWGARGQAQAGASWETILQHYYPGASLQRAY